MSGRKSFFGETIGKFADTLAVWMNAQIGKENHITGMHVEVTGGLIALGVAAYALSRPIIKGSIYQTVTGVFNVVTFGNSSNQDTTSDKIKGEAPKK